MSKKISKIGFLLLALFLAVAVFAPVIAPYDPYSSIAKPYMKPSAEHLLGTNDIGQDIFSEVVYGARTSMAIGFLSAALSLVLGTILGMLAGWYGGVIDRMVEKLIAFFLTIPYIPSIIILSALTKPGPMTTSIVLGVMSWSGTARVVRSQTISIKTREYIQTIRAMGASDGYIFRKHLIRNIF